MIDETVREIEEMQTQSASIVAVKAAEALRELTDRECHTVEDFFRVVERNSSALQRANRSHAPLYTTQQRIVDEVDRWSADRKSYGLPTARRLTRGRSDLRLGSRSYSTEWQMARYVDEPTVSTTVEDPSRVQVSRATVEGEIGYLRWEGPENESTLVVDGEFSERVEFDEYRTRDELIEAARKGRTGGAPQCVDSEQRWC